MFVERGGEGVVGLFYDTADWKPVLLGGRWRGLGELEFQITTIDHLVLGHLSGRLQSAWFAGVWNKTDGSRKRIALKVTDHRWPLTFSYPASWRIEVGKPSF